MFLKKLKELLLLKVLNKRKQEREKLTETERLLQEAYIDYINERKNSIILNSEKINALNPLAVLTRGFSVTEFNGKIAKSAGEVSVGDKIEIRLTDGKLGARVMEKEEL